MKRKIFFFHIAKTAGSSFNQFLGRHYIGKTHCEHFFVEGEQLTSLEELKNLDFISGHFRVFVFTKNNFSRQDYFLVTFIREPMAQLLSHLNWVMYIHDISFEFFNNLPQAVQEMSLELRSLNLYDIDSLIYALQKYAGWFQNTQSRYFSDASQGVCKNEAIENLSQLDMIGLTEHYEQSLRQFANARELEITDSAIEVVNKNPSYRVGKDLLNNPLIHEFLLDYNRIDLEVYSYFYPKIVQSFAQRSVA